MENKNLKKIAQCLCRGIRISVQGKLRYVSNCHCSQCMRTHGNYAAYTSCKEENIKFINKKTLRWYKSSRKAKRGFCNKCGASIFFKRIDNQNISIAAGMFQNPTELETKENIFTKGKLDYYKLDKKLPKFDKYFK